MSKTRGRIVNLLLEGRKFLIRQENPFKVNILKNLAARFAVSLTAQYQPIYITELGASQIILGYISSISGIVTTILSIPIGIIADRMGIKKIFLMNLSISIISAIIFGMSNTWQMAALGLILSSVALRLNRTACPMICGATLASSERITGIGICDTISFFPQLIAPIIGAFLITMFGGMNVEGIRPLYFFQIIGLVIAFIIIFTKFENPKFQSTTVRKTSILSDLRSILSEGTMIKRWILLTILTNFRASVMFYVPLFAMRFMGADQFIIGGMSAASTLVFVFLAIPLGHLADTRGRKKVIFPATGLVILSTLILIYAPNNIFLLLSGFLSGFGMTAGQTQMAIGADLVPTKYLGSWYGILGFFRGLVSIASPVICGIIWDAFNPQSVFLLIVLTQILGLGVLYTVPTSVTR